MSHDTRQSRVSFILLFYKANLCILSEQSRHVCWSATLHHHFLSLFSTLAETSRESPVCATETQGLFLKANELWLFCFRCKCIWSLIQHFFSEMLNDDDNRGCRDNETGAHVAEQQKVIKRVIWSWSLMFLFSAVEYQWNVINMQRTRVWSTSDS